jgi:O-antigen ligase
MAHVSGWRGIGGGPIGACAYVGGFMLPFAWDVPLLVLAAAGLFGAGTAQRRRTGVPPLTYPVLLFLAATCLSIAASADVARSLRLSAALLPGALLFFVIAGHFRSVRDTWLLFLTFSLVALGLGVALLWTGLTGTWPSTRALVSSLGSPALVVPNDVMLLALVAPFSLVLVRRPSNWAIVALALASLGVSVAAISLVRSRGALLIFVVAVTSLGTLLHRRVDLRYGLGALVVAVGVDAALGLPFLGKFAGSWNDRAQVWSAAWSWFLEAPLIGHGPHTFIYRSASGSTVVPWVHNLYLEVLAEQGLLGLAALAVLLCPAVVLGWRLRVSGDHDIRTVGTAACAALVALLAAAAIELTFLREWVVVTLFGLLGVIAQLAVLDRDGRESS